MKNNIIAIEVSKEYQCYVDKLIERTKREIYEWFEHQTIEDKINIYIYKDIPSLIEGLKRRGLGPYPEYMVACMVDEDQEKDIRRSINFYEPSKEPTETEYTKKEYNIVIFHELIHAIEHTIYGEQPEWLSEGIAKYLDGTYSQGIKWLLQNYINKIPVPEMKELEEEFGFHEYDSYDYAYIMVSYLIETMGKKRFLEFLHNANEVSDLSKGLITRSIQHYEKYFS